MVRTTPTNATAEERADILEALGKHRYLFRYTVQGMTDEQAGTTPDRERALPRRADQARGRHREGVGRLHRQRPAAGPELDGDIDWSNPPPEVLEYANGFKMVEGETLEGLLADYEVVAAATDELVKTVDLDARRALPEAPWFEPGATWSNRRVFTHIVAETAQHAGHADIIRETIDGQKSMG